MACTGESVTGIKKVRHKEKQRVKSQKVWEEGLQLDGRTASEPQITLNYCVTKQEAFQKSINRWRGESDSDPARKKHQGVIKVDQEKGM